MNPPLHTVDGVMSKVGLPLHFVDLALVSDDELADVTHMLAFALEFPADIRQAYDAVIHVQNIRSTDESFAESKGRYLPR